MSIVSYHNWINIELAMVLQYKTVHSGMQVKICVVMDDWLLKFIALEWFLLQHPGGHNTIISEETFTGMWISTDPRQCQVASYIQ